MVRGKLAALLAAVMVLLTGCSTIRLNEERAEVLAQILKQDFTAHAQLTSGEVQHQVQVQRQGEELSIQFEDEGELQGMRVCVTPQTMRILYGELSSEYPWDAGKQFSKQPAAAVWQVLQLASDPENTSLQRSGKDLALTPKGSQDFYLLADQNSGVICSISIPSLELTVEFSGFSYMP